MPCRGQDGKAAQAGATNILPDLLGLKHHDGTPITLNDCLAWANRVGQQSSELSQSRENLLCNFDGDPVEAELIRGMEAKLNTLHTARLAWLALANVFEVVQHDRE